MIPLTIRHVFDFGTDRALVGSDLARPEAWDALRIRTTGSFAIPADRSGFELLAAERPDIAARADAINAWATENGIDRLASYGVGGATLELCLWRGRPQRELVLTDYGPETVARLGELFPEVEVQHHDLRNDPPLRADAQLFHRIDTEFDDRELRCVMQRFSGERVLVVAAEVIGGRRATWELRARMRNRSVTRAGWLRNRASFERLWRATHHATPMRMHDLYAWDLRPR